MVTNLQTTFDKAVKLYGKDALKLLPIASERYNRSLFPTGGQYDWLSAVLLYCLIRFIRPIRIIEVSTSSGYSTLFSGQALKHNGAGHLYTFELSKSAADAAKKNFKRFDLEKVVTLYQGDAREKMAQLREIRKKGDVEILFLDSEHSVELAKDVITLMLEKTSPKSLLHVHDILPKDAKVTYRPLAEINNKKFRNKARLYWLLKKMLPALVPNDLRNWITPIPYRIETTEAKYILELSARINRKNQIFVHHLLDRYTAIGTGRFNKSSVGRADKNGVPMEWNESWWTTAKAVRPALKVA